MKIVYLKETDIPVWRKEWFKTLSRDEQEKIFMNMSDEEFKEEEAKLDRCQRIQERGESSEEYTEAVWADIDYEQSYICLRYQDEESMKQFEELVHSVSLVLADSGLSCSEPTPAGNGNSVSMEFEKTLDQGETTN